MLKTSVKWILMKAAAAVVALAVVVSLTPATARAQVTAHVSFTQQDAIQEFNVITGQGYQIGTATGSISGTTFVDFQLAVVGPPIGDVIPITFHNKVIITDLDGDQLFFDNDGSGSLHLGVPGAAFQGLGGPMVGTYILTNATGKYSRWKTGSTFDYRAVWTNPPAPPQRLGTVYVEVTSKHRLKY